MESPQKETVHYIVHYDFNFSLKQPENFPETFYAYTGYATTEGTARYVDDSYRRPVF